jgi:hypothetical protein
MLLKFRCESYSSSTSTKFEMVVSFKTAMALGITVPQSILLRVDEVME